MLVYFEVLKVEETDGKRYAKIGVFSTPDYKSRSIHTTFKLEVRRLEQSLKHPVKEGEQFALQPLARF